MSTGVDTRRRPNLWSYISFSSSPRRRSFSLPTRQADPYEKPGRHLPNGSTHHPGSGIDSMKEAWMAQSPRARYLKTGGIFALILFLFYFFGPTDVRNTLNGRYNIWNHAPI